MVFMSSGFTLPLTVWCMISLRGLAISFVSTHQAENPRGFSEVGE